MRLFIYIDMSGGASVFAWRRLEGPMPGYSGIKYIEYIENGMELKKER